ncbi:hypothetical protein E2562_036619 [Oryza meyeriana var. granulata]|uniref:Uncharacterized protein n=1 Tax=Oryza meyeriana var. granulata TaxID=110450 RepID=A0A6G1BQ45_9ORYZ|nr:hypothetical protein E2562_036619 [Oryza meyeriana var. granulata]
MVEAHVVAICVTVAALALAAAVLGVSYVRYDGVNCAYRRTPAFGCGIAGAAAMLAGQVIVTAATGCWDRCRASSDHRRVAVVFSSVLSWHVYIYIGTV